MKSFVMRTLEDFLEGLGVGYGEARADGCNDGRGDGAGVTDSVAMVFRG